MKTSLTDREKIFKSKQWKMYVKSRGGQVLTVEEFAFNDGFFAGLNCQLPPLPTRYKQLKEACLDLIAYLDKIESLNFQLEKADDFINNIRTILDNN